MILSQNRKRSKEFRSEFWLLGGLLALLLAGLLYILYNYRYEPVSLNPGESILCDAERVRGSHFVRDNYQFDNGNMQSSEAARSGWFSCRVPEGESAQYGFGYRLESSSPGEVYRVSVWRYKNILNEGKLAVNGTGPVGFYHESDEVMRLEDGWEKLSLTFHIPYGSEIEYVNIYVYTNGYQPVFFDDLEIERIDVWAEADFQPEVLDLEIGPGGREDLADKRREAIQRGILFSDSDDWVKARIRNGTEKIPVRLRLKGDWLDHLADDKWSFRVKVRDPYEWKHLKVFSLHTPAARYHLHEWVLHQLWEQEDILTTRYDFVELQVDGESRGIYAYEEHFTKQLVESRRRREGPILKFNEDGLWLAYQRELETNGFIMFGYTPSAAAWENADITAFEADDLAADTTQGPLLDQAKNLLADYFSGKLPAERVFDLDRLAAYYASCDALNAYHGVVWHNQRYYFNPITGLLEPIGFDGFGGPPADSYTFLGEGALNPQSLMSDNLFHRLAQDTAFTRRYIQRLYHYTDQTFFEPFLDSIRQKWTARREWLRMEFPSYEADLSDLRERTRFIHSMVLPYEGQSVKAVRLLANGKNIRLQNTHTLPVEVVGWSSEGSDQVQRLDAVLLLPGQMPRAYTSRLRADSLMDDFASLRFLEDRALREQRTPVFKTVALPSGAARIYYRPFGLDTLFSSVVVREAAAMTPDYAQLFKDNLLEEQPFYRIQDKFVTFFPGQHEVRRHIYIPAGYQVEIPAGTQLDLRDGAAFVSRSPVNAMGEQEAPVRIFSGDGSGNGFTVLNSGKASVFKNVDFSGLNTLSAGGWHLTGAVNFYESPVRFYRCRFAANHCEDALNVIRSEFQLEACRFEETFSDAFDSDFSKGEVRNCGFFRTGNDGLDVSGSIVNVFECQFDTNGDKGISVGEASDLTVFNSSFRNAPIALASKDESMLYVRNVTLEQCEQGFAAYQKKPEYGGATILVEGYKADQVKRLFVEGEGSRIRFDREALE
ncbi:CotH kinase family protein [Flavilitoribacter nigricans]|uniref:Right handed beta helix domain-containing protein n=1 Tax=Flavilitoribacter nigricans (strain ATCC 23147 / DSM 23189 / NBRC 102662 / NCIMB 1420 / SS-2) TaxID=1122177 RepID=A0A2D0MXM8_FLAN2|nr:CotH kinase family protein [Flavilitoribacter nigricans]PHN00967.1 hypothetical protein CRP01_39485 [Flavilitoribacter nigricans DSM 23189 = NBRC 102662]